MKIRTYVGSIKHIPSINYIEPVAASMERVRYLAWATCPFSQPLKIRIQTILTKY
jgi:hypothetical protein